MAPLVKVTSAANTQEKVREVVKNVKTWAEGDGRLNLDFIGSKSCTFSSLIFAKEEQYVSLQDIITRVNTETGLVSMDTGEVPDLVTRALLLDAHHLDATIMEKAFPAGVTLELYNLKAQQWAKTLMKIQDNGLSNLRQRAFQLAIYFITSDESFLTIATELKNDIYGWFFAKCSRPITLYLLNYWRDIINFPLLIQATNGNKGDGKLNSGGDPWQKKYSTYGRLRWKSVL